MLKDTTDWCVDGVLKDHKIIKKFSATSKTSSYLAKDQKGERIALTYVDRDRILERYGVAAYANSHDLKGAETIARKKLAQFEEEQRLIVERTTGLAHAHVAEIYCAGFDREKDQMVILSEYVPGLDMYLGTRGFTPRQMISLFMQALEGLEFIHQNRMLHLNLKPSRIRIDHEGIPPIVKITDFGFAIPFENYEGEYFGTPLFEAPEIVFGEKEKIDEKTDLYSLAVVMYYCLSEHFPFEDRAVADIDRESLKMIVKKEMPACPTSQYVRDVPVELDDLILKLLQPDPSNRGFKNATEVIYTFEKTWPKESREMPHEMVTTLTEQ